MSSPANIGQLPSTKTQIGIINSGQEEIVLRPGCIATLEHVYGRENPKTTQYKVVPCGQGDLNKVPQAVCVNAPIITPFLNQEVGHEAKIMLARKLVLMRLVGIEQPDDVRLN
jgi:hypothetical protein